jgi:hypothetical protein
MLTSADEVRMWVPFEWFYGEPKAIASGQDNQQNMPLVELPNAIANGSQLFE